MSLTPCRPFGLILEFQKVERETGFVVPGTKPRVEFIYWLANEGDDQE